MKKSLALLAAIASAALCCVVAWAADRLNREPNAPVLPASEYRVPLDEVIVRGKRPYWQSEEAPRWDRPKVEAPKPGDASGDRLQWAPRYTREERDDFNGPSDQLHAPEARTKLFELRF